MAVPGYQEFMLPLLKLAADGSEHPIREAMDTLAAQLGISAQDRQIMLPSGTQTRYYNRVTWATTYLTKSGLLEKTGRGRIRITPRGRTGLAQNPPRIDNAFLAVPGVPGVQDEAPGSLTRRDRRARRGVGVA